MPNDPPPSPPRRTPWAYALAAAAIWTLAAYALLAPKPAPPMRPLAAGAAASACLR
jgi:hypothetical protein